MTVNKGNNGNINWKVSDWSREKPRRIWDPGRRLLKSIRSYQKMNSQKGCIYHILKRYFVIAYRFWSIVTGADIPLDTKIEGGLMIPHPNGIVIHPDSVIGANCLIFQQVTLANVVLIGYHVDIGAGAKLIGPIVIGNNVKIGANSVVTKDVPSGKTVAGVPAVEMVISRDNKQK